MGKLSLDCTDAEFNAMFDKARRDSEKFGRVYILANNEHVWPVSNVAIKEREILFGAIVAAVFVHGRLAS